MRRGKKWPGLYNTPMFLSHLCNYDQGVPCESSEGCQDSEVEEVKL